MPTETKPFDLAKALVIAKSFIKNNIKGLIKLGECLYIDIKKYKIEGESKQINDNESYEEIDCDINELYNNQKIIKNIFDNEIIEFFKNNKLDEFPNIIEKFYSMPTGAHKADLFRYYFLYITQVNTYISFNLRLKTNIS